MKAKRATRNRPRAPVGCLVAAIAAMTACADGGPTAPEAWTPEAALSAVTTRAGAPRLTGTLDLVWKGGRGSGAPTDPGRISQAEIAAFAGVPAGDPGPGSFTYRVLNGDGTVHREIGVTLGWVGPDDPPAAPGAMRFIGVVVSDTKPCGGSGGGDGGGCDHGDEGGCSHDEPDGGCSHDEPDGGCSHDEPDGGCSGGGSGGSGDPGGPGGSGSHPSGSDCRIGQVVVGWALDGGTPAVRGDRISWKWFAPDAPKVLAIQAAIAEGATIPWPCRLCEKEIIGGNLTLRLPPG